jgi:hypothetical protein
LAAVVLALWAKSAADRGTPAAGGPPAAGTEEADGVSRDAADREG